MTAECRPPPGTAKLLRHAADFADMAERFRDRGDTDKALECALLAAQCLQAARLMDDNDKALARIVEPPHDR